jgi:hypothetical protein
VIERIRERCVAIGIRDLEVPSGNALGHLKGSHMPNIKNNNNS